MAKAAALQHEANDRRAQRARYEAELFDAQVLPAFMPSARWRRDCSSLAHLHVPVIVRGQSEGLLQARLHVYRDA